MSPSPKMRGVYFLIAFFLMLCVFFTQWYLCAVRGLCFPLAINEILVLLMVATFVGFASSWLLRESSFGELLKRSSALSREKGELMQQLKALEKESLSTRKLLADWQQEAIVLGQQRSAREEMIREVQAKVASLEDDLGQNQRRYDSLKKEYDEVRESVDILKRELQAERSRAKPQEMEKPAEAARSEHQEMMEEGLEVHELFRSRFTPSTWQTRDDLSLISGIGPVIHKKLNDLGIYSFQQLSELTPAMVRRIANAIKFFPDRIGRDNWIGQAAAFMKRK